VSRLQRSGRRLAPQLQLLLLSAAATAVSHLQLLHFIVVVLHLLLLLSDGLLLERARHGGGGGGRRAVGAEGCGPSGRRQRQAGELSWLISSQRLPTAVTSTSSVLAWASHSPEGGRGVRVQLAANGRRLNSERANERL